MHVAVRDPAWSAIALEIAQTKKFLKGKAMAVDSTLFDAEAAMKSIVPRDNGDDCKKTSGSRRLKKESKIPPTKIFASSIRHARVRG